MKQFLLLNEQIEEMKWQRKMHSYKRHNASFRTSSFYTGSSGFNYWSGSTMSSCASRLLSTEYLDSKYPSPSELSIFNVCYSTTETLNPSTLDVRLRDVTEEVTQDKRQDIMHLDRAADSDMLHSCRTSDLETVHSVKTAGLNTWNSSKTAVQPVRMSDSGTMRSFKTLHSLDISATPTVHLSKTPDTDIAHQFKTLDLQTMRSMKTTSNLNEDIDSSTIERTMSCQSAESLLSPSRHHSHTTWSQEPEVHSQDSKKSSTLTSTASNESSCTESNSVDSGISLHDLTLLGFSQNI